MRQNAYLPNDALSSPKKTFALATAALEVLHKGEAALAAGSAFSPSELVPARRALMALRDGAGP